MCGRYTLAADPTAVQQAFDLDVLPQMAPRYNIAPTQPVAIITNENPKVLTYVQWGLVPSWSKDPSIGGKMFNARSETVDEKPSFKSAFKRRRCLIPADGFYEWTKQGSRKQPMYIHLKDRPVFGFAGIWENWQGKDGSEIASCTILTTTPNELVAPLHNRMAVILDEADYELWMSPDELPPEALKPLLRAYPAEKMAVYAVSTLVNSATNEGPELIAPYEPPQQQSLL